MSKSKLPCFADLKLTKTTLKRCLADICIFNSSVLVTMTFTLHQGKLGDVFQILAPQAEYWSPTSIQLFSKVIFAQ